LAHLFYDFGLDDHVPPDHLLRSIDGHLDFEGLHETLKGAVNLSGRFVDERLRFEAPFVRTRAVTSLGWLRIVSPG